MPLFQRALPNVEGKTFTSVIVGFPPGARAASHQHGGAFVWVYVLASTVRSKLDDAPIRTCREGESWCELPGARLVLTERQRDGAGKAAGHLHLQYGRRAQGE